MSAFSGDLSVVWMNGSYPNYVDYATTITAAEDGPGVPPVADAEASLRAGPAPLEVHFDGLSSYDPDGAIESFEWSFGDGASVTGEQVSHTYASGGRYFPRLTVTDAQGLESTYVDEVVVDLPAAPAAHSGGAAANTVHGAVNPQNQPSSWRVEYGPTGEYGAVTAAVSLPAADSFQQVSAALPGLIAGRLYHYRVVATTTLVAPEGEDRVLVAGAGGGSDPYRDAVLGDGGARLLLAARRALRLRAGQRARRSAVPSRAPTCLAQPERSGRSANPRRASMARAAPRRSRVRP